MFLSYQYTNYPHVPFVITVVHQVLLFEYRQWENKSTPEHGTPGLRLQGCPVQAHLLPCDGECTEAPVIRMEGHGENEICLAEASLFFLFL